MRWSDATDASGGSGGGGGGGGGGLPAATAATPLLRRGWASSGGLASQAYPLQQQQQPGQPSPWRD